jgi:hypothetical protein
MLRRTRRDDEGAVSPPAPSRLLKSMRPLIVFTGQGVARADGFNLTRRMKAVPALARAANTVGRKDRQNLDALLEACAAAGAEALDDALRTMRAICLKERRTTERKSAHREVFAALAEAARQRVVVHLTANVDGLTTTFAVRDFGAVWPPFRGTATAGEVAAAVQDVLDRGVGFVHLPVHGEACLAVAGPAADVMQTFYGEPRALRGSETWRSSLLVGPIAGMSGIEERLPPARLGYGLLEALLEPHARAADGFSIPDGPAADLLVVGYGADDRGARADHPLERRLTRLATGRRRDPASRWTALVYRPAESRRTAAWFADRGFAVVPYDDGELPRAVRQALVRMMPTARCSPLECERLGDEPGSPSRP